MAFKPAICSQCGATIQVDDGNETGFCSHCGTKFVTEKVINQYQITNNVTNNVTQNIQTAIFNTGDTVADYFRRVTALLKAKDVFNAKKVCEEMYQKFPDKGISHVCKADVGVSEGYTGTVDFEQAKGQINAYENALKENGGAAKAWKANYKVFDFNLDNIITDRDYLQKTIDQGKGLLTPEEKELYADYIQSVEEKIVIRGKYVRLKDKAKGESATFYLKEDRIATLKKIGIIAGVVAVVALGIFIAVKFFI